MAMPPEKVCKMVRQINQRPVPKEDMERLLAVAKDYCAVKNYVYQRYGGIRSLSKLYPGYTVQNEMTKSGLRSQLGLPSVYFYLAVFDALGDIKAQWSRTKTVLLKHISQNSGFTPQDKHYLRFLLKAGDAMGQVLCGRPVELGQGLQQQYVRLSQEVDTARLCRYLCRQVRRNHKKLQTQDTSGFSVSERAYRYGGHGVYLSVKEKRRRVFVPLTDNNQYKRQLYVKLYPQQGNICIHAPVDVRVHSHPDYRREVGLALGMFTMLTTDEGHPYGEAFGSYQSSYSSWLCGQAAVRRQGSGGRGKKYLAKKRRLESQLHSYINQELNRFLREEKPQAVYIPKFPKPQAGGWDKKANQAAALWQRGYIRRRLAQKCREESVAFVEVFGKGISRECSQCGAQGIKKDGAFSCPVCGFKAEEKTNTARNAKKRGRV